MEHIRTPKVGATGAGGGGRAGARGRMLSRLEARLPCPAQTELAPRASEGGGGAGASPASPGGWASSCCLTGLALAAAGSNLLSLGMLSGQRAGREGSLTASRVMGLLIG